MKNKSVIGILVVMALFFQGLAFAETAEDNVVAVAEDMDILAVDPATGMVAEEDVLMVDELEVPDEEPADQAVM